MKILFFHRWVGVRKGGAETHIKELAARFGHIRHTVFFVTLIALFGMCLYLFNFYCSIRIKGYYKNYVNFDNSGLRRFYYPNSQWCSKPEKTKVDQKILFSSEKNVEFRKDEFSIKWEGIFHAKRSGKYKFYLRSDDGSQLFIDGRIILDNGGIHPADKEISKKMFLWRGFHYININFFQNLGLSEIEFYWRPVGISRGKSNDLSDNFYPVKPLFSVEEDEPALYKIIAFRRNGNYFLLYGIIILLLFIWVVSFCLNEVKGILSYIYIKLKLAYYLIEDSKYLPYIFLSVLILAIYGEIIFMPAHMAFSSDAANIDAASRLMVKKDIMDHGEIPLWNPYLLSGTPFIGRSCSNYNPIDIIVMLLTMNVYYAYRISVLLHILIAAFGVYILLNFLSKGNLLLNIGGALLYIFNTTYLGFIYSGYMHIYPVSYLPFIYYYFLKASSKWLEWDPITNKYGCKLAYRYFILIAFLLFVQIISGGGEIFLFTSIIMNLSFIVMTVYFVLRFRKSYPVFTYFVGYLFMWCSVVLLSLFYILPVYIKYPFSNRLDFIQLSGNPTISSTINIIKKIDNAIKIIISQNYHPIMKYVVLSGFCIGLVFLVFKRYRKILIGVILMSIILYLAISVNPRENLFYKLFYNYYPMFKMTRNFDTRGSIITLLLVLILVNHGLNGLMHYLKKYFKFLPKIIIFVIFIFIYLNSIYMYRTQGRGFLPAGVTDGVRTILINSVNKPNELQAKIAVRHIYFSKGKRYCWLEMHIQNLSHNHVWLNTKDIPESKRLYIKYNVKTKTDDIWLGSKYAINENVYPLESFAVINKICVPEYLKGKVELWMHIVIGEDDIVSRRVCIFNLDQESFKIEQINRDIYMGRLLFPLFSFLKKTEKEKVRYYFDKEIIIGYYTSTVFDIEHTGLWDQDGINYIFSYFDDTDLSLDVLHGEKFEKMLVEKGEKLIKKFSILNTKYFFLEKRLSNPPSYLTEIKNEFGAPMYLSHNYLRRVNNPIIPILYIGEDINKDFNSSIVKQLVECRNFDPQIMAIYHGDSKFIDGYDRGFLNKFKLILLGNYYAKSKKDSNSVLQGISRKCLNIKIQNSNGKIFIDKYSLIQCNGRIGYLRDKVDIEKIKNFNFVFKKYTCNKRFFSVEGLMSPFIFFSEVFYPGWKAYVDGERKDVFMCNGIGIGIVLDNNNIKDIFLEYKPNSYMIGAWIFSFSALLLFLLYYKLRTSGE